jgi:hypothetical protein
MSNRTGRRLSTSDDIMNEILTKVLVMNAENTPSIIKAQNLSASSGITCTVPV